MIEKDERNKIMDGEIGWWESHKWTLFDTNSSVSNAIRECDKLARAWDILSKEVDENLAGYAGTRKKMDRILSDLIPTPKDPLEELENNVQQLHDHADKMFSTKPSYDIDYYRGVLGTSSRILAEIRRLRGKK